MLSNVLQIRTAHYKYQYSTEKEVVRKSFLLMGTGGLRGCMISHSTDANPTIRHQPLHCHNAPLSCTSTSYLKLNPALDINLCFAVFYVLMLKLYIQSFAPQYHSWHALKTRLLQNLNLFIPGILDIKKESRL